MSINFNELRELLGAIAQTDITELILKTDTFELSVRKEKEQVQAIAPIPISQAPAPVAAPLTTTVEPPTPAIAEPAPPVETPAPSPIDQKWTPITSPMVGTFYRAPGPEEPPFVDVGDSIRKGQTVCIIEAMKLMNEIEAEISGQIMEIVVANGEPVEYGQTLLWVKAS
ncbi:MAG: acetyl-CoA carboxylase biotin carboxyl carrier protein [Snowella sp.]|nr:acetyl-CoA carboxylase biotin carboxyl carrier protein [Snowella sp.]